MMRAYLSVFRMRLINGMQYRIAALAGIATQFFWGFMYIMIYEAFYSNSTSSTSISLSELTSYVWLQQAFLAFVMLWFKDSEILNLITTGNIAYELCRPCGLYGFWFAKLLAQRISSAFLRCIPLLLVAFLLPKPYGLTLPPTFEAFILFLVTLALGVLVLVAISMFIYISVFITMSPVGSMLMIAVLGEFFGGSVIPIPLMPEWLQKIAYLLPFRLSSDLPFRVFSGNIPVNTALYWILIQLLWLTVLVTLGRLSMNKILRKVIVQGG